MVVSLIEGFSMLNRVFFFNHCSTLRFELKHDTCYTKTRPYLSSGIRVEVLFLARFINGGKDINDGHLNCTNYQKGKGKTRDFLFVKYLHLPMFVSNKSKKQSDKKWSFENKHVGGLIPESLGDNVLKHIVNETNA